MKQYQRLNLEEREEISRLLSQGLSLRQIALKVSRNVSTVSREVRRSNSGRSSYRAITADRHSGKRASTRRGGKRKIVLNPLLRQVVHDKLSLFWSPQQIENFLKQNYEDLDMQISTESIYSYIYILPRGQLREELTQQLRRGHKRRRVRGQAYAGGPIKIEDMLSIEERPKEVADRTVPGHWEGDLIIGGAKEQTVLGTLVERTTRAVLLVRLKSKKAFEVRKAFARTLMKLPKELRLSLTYDQGGEMSQHKLFTEETQIKVYFAHPKSPWERGTNENTNGLLRQFFPKGTNFNNVSLAEIKRAQHLLNGRPRKTLNWKTPYEAISELFSEGVALNS